MINKVIIFVVVIIAWVDAQSCPEKNGRFPTSQCDKYLQCEDGVAEEKLCPDGLLFNDKAKFFSYPCSYPTDVDCTGREATQPPQPTGDCPHQFGYFAVGDSSHCGQFMNCADGRGYVMDCPEGLAFDTTTLQCNWADQVATCDAEAYLGFRCPQEKVGPLGPQGFFRTFRSLDNDCSRYFICLEGGPRMARCGNGTAFNQDLGGCDDIANVPDCVDTLGSRLQ